VLLFSLLDDLPELIREDVTTLVQLVLRGLVLAQVGELVTEVVEVLNELLKFLLLGVRTVHKFEILLLHMVKIGCHTLSLHSNLSEDFLHLELIGLT
jgi:hypothetical protein